MKVYCTNENCHIREQCAKKELPPADDPVIFDYFTRYNGDNDCLEFEAIDDQHNTH